MTVATHPCARPGCGQEVPTGRLACRAHWLELSPALRAEVLHLWRAVLGGGDAYVLERYEALLGSCLLWWETRGVRR